MALALALAGSAAAQQFEDAPRPAGEAGGYLPADTVDYRDVTGPPPAPGSLDDQLDVAEVRDLQHEASPERYSQAQADAERLFPRFSPALGEPLDRAHLPRTIQLLYNSIHDAEVVTVAGKRGWRRIRPFQRLELERVCGFAHPPAPDADPRQRSSYPSGHTTAGYTTALVLAQVAPTRRGALLEEARDYGLSRIICAAHFPTDVEAGRAVASAVFERLMTTPAFRHDLQCARSEYQGLAGLVPGEVRAACPPAAPSPVAAGPAPP